MDNWRCKTQERRRKQGGSERPGRDAHENHAWMCIVSSGWE